MTDNRDTGKANFQGDQFKRFEELDVLFDSCSNSSVLDIGMSDGLISYEFARHGATTIHGIEIDDERVRFAKRLFSNIPVVSSFKALNLAFESDKLQNSAIFLPYYDIVLFLGVYHHLKKQMKRKDLDDLLEGLLGLSEKHFAVRTNQLPEIEDRIISAGFERLNAMNAHSKEKIGTLGIYKRISNRQ